MDAALFLHRFHFAFTVSYHYLFPQLTMGLAESCWRGFSTVVRGAPCETGGH